MTDPVDRVTRPSRRTLITTLVISGVVILAIFAALIGQNKNLFGNGSKDSASNNAAATASAETPADQPSTKPTNTPSPFPTGDGSGCDLGRIFTIHVQSYLVERDAGAVFSGTACLKNGDQILAFDFDPEDELFYLDTDENNTAAIVSSSGVWTWTDAPIGNEGAGVSSDTTLASGDSQFVYFVLADTACQKWVSGQSPNDDGDIVLNNIKQHNCKVASTQRILVTDLP